LWIADDNFTLDMRYLKEFCRRIAGVGMRWSCLSRVTGITARLARQMRQSGCRRVYLGLETGDPDTLRLMKKQASVEDGRIAVELFHEAGIEVAAFFIVGYPGETPSSVEATLQWAIELPLDYISFNVPFPLPGSPLFERLHSVNPNKDWNEENEVSFVYDSEFDADWLRQRIGATMQAFADKKGHK
jgi:anaerobic magnesium-protoporphyrin IX monomethyl ester cyclase